MRLCAWKRADCGWRRSNFESPSTNHDSIRSAFDRHRIRWNQTMRRRIRWRSVQASGASQADCNFLLVFLFCNQRRLAHIDLPHADRKRGRSLLRGLGLLFVSLRHSWSFDDCVDSCLRAWKVDVHREETGWEHYREGLKMYFRKSLEVSSRNFYNKNLIGFRTQSRLSRSRVKISSPIGSTTQSPRTASKW